MAESDVDLELVVEALALTNNVTCQSMDTASPLERVMFLYLYPFIIVLCLGGNTANLLVYNHKFLRSSTTIRMLAMKSLANTCNVISLLPMYASSVALLDPSSHLIVPSFFWLSLRYMVFFTNLFDTVAVWLTTAVSIESCLLVVFPMQAKFWCTMRNTWVVIGGCLVGSVLLHWFNLVGREVDAVLCFDVVGNNISETLSFEQNYLALQYEHVYYWVSAVSTICVPMLVMLCTTCLIKYQLVWSSVIMRGTEQKRCVVRLSFATAICHVVFQMPHLGVFVIAAIASTASDWPPAARALNTAANFLSMLNASISFVVYFACSKRFRQLCAMTLRRQTQENGASARLSISHRRSEILLSNNRFSIGNAQQAHDTARQPLTAPAGGSFRRRDGGHRRQKRVSNIGPSSVSDDNLLRK